MTVVAAAQRWVLRAGVFGLPLAYSPFTYDSFVLPKLIFARLLVLVLFLLWLGRIGITRTVVLRRTPLDLPILLFLGSAAVSSIFAENRNVAWLGTYGRYDGLLTLLTYAALFWLAVQSLAGREEAAVLVRVVLGSGYVVAAGAIAQSLHDSAQQGIIAPAFGTLGNANVLGAFLALVITLTFGELMTARLATARILLINVLVVTGFALVLSLSRSGWFGTLGGIIFMVAFRARGWAALRVVVPAVAVGVILLAAAYVTSSPGQLQRTFVDRALSVTYLQVLERARLGIWRDSVRLIASRPIWGYGPDNVGLVFPRFQTGDWGSTYSYATGNVRQPIDKAHSELLQVAATQGLIGVTAYLWLQIAAIRMVWRARHSDEAVVAGGGWIAYQLVLLLNFTALAAALPFWIFAAALVESCQAIREKTRPIDRRLRGLALGIGVLAGAVIVWWGVGLSYVADVRVREAVAADFAGKNQDARRLAAEARTFAPWESVYAVEVANVAFERNQWAAARAAYIDAAGLGTFNDLVYRNLALADRNLGLTAEARAAARQAVQLDRFDPANQALLAEFDGQT